MGGRGMEREKEILIYYKKLAHAGICKLETLGKAVVQLSLSGKA